MKEEKKKCERCGRLRDDVAFRQILSDIDAYDLCMPCYWRISEDPYKGLDYPTSTPAPSR